MIVIERGVEIAGLTRNMNGVIAATEKVFKDWGIDKCRITSAYRIKASPGSCHADGNGIDFGARHIEVGDREGIRRDLATACGRNFDVVLKHSPPHFHVEYDNRIGR